MRDTGRGLRAEQWARFCGRYVCADVIEKLSRHRLLERTTSYGRWGSEPELGPHIIQVSVECLFERYGPRKCCVFVFVDSSGRQSSSMQMTQCFNAKSITDPEIMGFIELNSSIRQFNELNLKVMIPNKYLRENFFSNKFDVLQKNLVIKNAKTLLFNSQTNYLDS